MSLHRIIHATGLAAGILSASLWLAGIVAAFLAGCVPCADLREATVAGPNRQLAHVCFVDRDAMAVAIATGKLDPSKIASARVCLKSESEIPAGTRCR